jgi:3-deoxy-manno-octulosonate cytidylyltransferase (CMP-KDO synthetase)
VKVLVAIPARLKSTRLPDKVLARETGKYLIQHTYERACRARLPEKVVIAADDDKILEAARSFGAECVLTRSDHASGTDRIAEAVAGVDAEIIVNLQGDEPQIDPDYIDCVARLLLENEDFPMATLCAPFSDAGQVSDPNIVKVVVAPLEARAEEGRIRQPQVGKALYFSRSVIPYDRQEGGVGGLDRYRRHLGIYAYRKDFLLEITSLPQTTFEKAEKLEQLRALESGFSIVVGTVEHAYDGIDTPQQYARFVTQYKTLQTAAGVEGGRE